MAVYQTFITNATSTCSFEPDAPSQAWSSIDNASNAQANSAIRRFTAQLEAEKCQEKGPPFNPAYKSRSSAYHLINNTPSRGSSIGRACGSYNSKEINLKVVGSSPTFGYSYIKAHSEQLFFCFFGPHVYVATGKSGQV
jgi:hypothetical protein